MTSFIPPWAKNFTNDINNEMATVVKDVTPAPAAPSTPQAPAPAPADLQKVIARVTSGSIASELESAVVAAAKDAWPAIQPQLEADAMAYVQSYVQQTLAGNTTPQIPNVTFDGQSLTQTAAKAHAWRTFLIGMGTTSLSAVLSAIGGQAHLDLFSKEGWVATGTLALGTLVQTAISYVSRLKFTPTYEKQLAAAPPSAVAHLIQGP